MNTETQSTTGHADLGQYLTFLLGAERFAIPGGAIREIIRLPALTGVPMMPAFLRGVINLRGAVLPVIDLSLRLGLSATIFTKRTCVIILDLPQRGRASPVGLLVDVVHAVRALDASRIQPPATYSRIRADYLLGAVEQDGDPVTVLDVQRVLDPEALSACIGRPSAERFGLSPAPTARGAL